MSFVSLLNCQGPNADGAAISTLAFPFDGALGTNESLTRSTLAECEANKLPVMFNLQPVLFEASRLRSNASAVWSVAAQQTHSRRASQCGVATSGESSCTSSWARWSLPPPPAVAATAASRDSSSSGSCGRLLVWPVRRLQNALSDV